jgi:hypothetical protein
MHIAAVFKESGIQRAENVALRIQVVPKVPFQRLGIAANFICQAACCHAFRQRTNRRKLRHELAVDEHQLAR